MLTLILLLSAQTGDNNGRPVIRPMQLPVPCFVAEFQLDLLKLGMRFRLPKLIYFGCAKHTTSRNLPVFFLISLSLGETLLLEPFDGKVYDLLPVFLPELLSYPSNHLCLPLPLLPSILASKMCLSSVSWYLM